MLPCRVLGFIGKITNSALSVLKQVNNSVSTELNTSMIEGRTTGLSNILWDNIYFVFTKSDEINWTRRENESFWYDIGRVFGQGLHNIDLPSKSSFMKIILPQYDKSQDKHNNLNLLIQKLYKLILNYVSNSTDEKIINLCDCLNELLCDNKVNNKLYPVINTKYIDIEEIKNNALRRIKIDK